jgi:hypothetical protein
MVNSCSPNGVHGAVLEDDGDTGYLYATLVGPPLKILGAIQIYRVGSVVLRGRRLNVRFDWSTDGMVSLVTIDGDDAAVLDFQNRRAGSRFGSDVSGDPWTTAAWSDEEMRRLRASARRRESGYA